MSHPIDFDLYLVTDRHQTRGRPMEKVVREALMAGVRAVQLREKDLAAREFLRWARLFRVLTVEFGAKLMINDRADICLAVGADGVHLTGDSLPIPVVRKILGPDRLIGQSTHDFSQVMAAEESGADFVVLGPVYDTPSKRSMGRPLGLAVCRETVSRCSVPVFAIGGIRPDRIQDVLRTGCRGIAVISAVMNSAEPKEVIRKMLEELRIRRPSAIETGA